MIDYVDRVLARFPEARLIYLTRDPRDVAVSSRDSVFNPFHPYFTAQLSAREQRTGLALLERLEPQTIQLVRYEDLLLDPAGQVARLCSFLDEPYEEPMLRFFETAEAKKSAVLSQAWRNTARPIQTENRGKYRTELSRPDPCRGRGRSRRNAATGLPPRFPAGTRHTRAGDPFVLSPPRCMVAIPG